MTLHCKYLLPVVCLHVRRSLTPTTSPTSADVNDQDRICLPSAELGPTGSSGFRVRCSTAEGRIRQGSSTVESSVRTMVPTDEPATVGSHVRRPARPLIEAPDPE